MIKYSNDSKEKKIKDKIVITDERADCVKTASDKSIVVINASDRKS